MQQTRHSMVPAVYLIMRQEGKILGIFRTNTGYMDGFWTLPSGHVEKEELPLRGMIRETKEEVGIDVEADKLKFAHLMTRPAENETGERVDIFFETNEWKGPIGNPEPDKHGKVEWVDFDSVKWIPTQKYAISCIERGIQYSEWSDKDEKR